MRLNINLATRTYLNARVITICIASSLVLLLLTILLLVRSVAGNAGEIERLNRDIATLQGKPKGDVNEKEYQKVLAKIGFANGVIAKKTYNWLLLLDWLERVVPDGIAISGIEPDSKTFSLKLTGIAQNFSNIRRLVEQMEDSTFFKEVYLLSQSEMKVGISQVGTTFAISCKVALK